MDIVEVNNPMYRTDHEAYSCHSLTGTDKRCFEFTFKISSSLKSNTYMLYFGDDSSTVESIFSVYLIYNNYDDPNNPYYQIQIILGDTYNRSNDPGPYTSTRVRLEEEEVYTILYAKDGWFALKDFAALDPSAIGLTWTMTREVAEAQCGSDMVFQGKLDPSILHSSPAEVKRETLALIKEFEG